MPSKFENVTILLPAMDETYSLKETVDVIASTCDHKDLAEFILLLCNRTTSESRKTAEKLVEDYKGILPIYIHDQKLPFVGGAIREGIDLAKGSHVVMMSSDLETDPHIIRQFIERSKRHPNRIITATRWKKGGGFEKYNKVKLVCNLIFERAIGFFYFTGLSDLTYAYRIFPTDLMQKINWEELKHPFFLETALKPLRLGVKFQEIPAHWVARTEGVSQNTFFANFKYFKTAWHNRFLSKSQILKK
ncbi:Glycosyl transferase family 2 [Lachnospiraceae bacterium]|nr:Glycosyl transferase family 2 [Lachnospiraceae bacterium]